MEKKDNSGALFNNDRKETDKHPDMTGTITIEGKEYWLSAWNNTSKAGKKYMGLSAQMKEEKAAVGAVNDAPNGLSDADIPY